MQEKSGCGGIDFQKKGIDMKVFFAIAASVLLVCQGCKTLPKREFRYSVETGTTDIWATNPKQSVSVRIEMRQ